MRLVDTNVQATQGGTSVDEAPRAADSATCVAGTPERDDASSRDLDADHSPRAEQATRTAQSVRAEQAYRDLNALPPSQRPLALANASLAAAFDAVMHEAWLAGEEAYSNCAVARACGVDEKTVRQWRDGRKPLPASALTLMPTRVREQLETHIADERGAAPKRGVFLVRQGVALMRTELSHDDARESLRAVRAAKRELEDLATSIEDRIEVAR